MSDDEDAKEKVAPPESASPATRRVFLKVGTVAVGGTMTAIVSVPAVRYVFHPVGRDLVTSPDEPLDTGLVASELVAGGDPVKVDLRVGDLRDAWTAHSGVAVGSAWVRKTEAGEITALSSTCPHLGCAVDFRAEEGLYRCPCHRSAFAIGGEKKGGPAKRGLDPLPVDVDEEGRVKLTFKRYRQDISERIEA